MRGLGQAPHGDRTLIAAAVLWAVVVIAIVALLLATATSAPPFLGRWLVDTPTTVTLRPQLLRLQSKSRGQAFDRSAPFPPPRSPRAAPFGSPQSTPGLGGQAYGPRTPWPWAVLLLVAGGIWWLGWRAASAAGGGRPDAPWAAWIEDSEPERVALAATSGQQESPQDVGQPGRSGPTTAGGQPMADSAQAEQGSDVPAPPWRFPHARCLYQPAWVPAQAAQAATPPDVTLLSLFGWTLGGTFVVEWTDSPVGPYREVAVLSALVVRGGVFGAWVSHIVVDSPDAMVHGRELWGLPARVGSVAFEAAPDNAAGRLVFEEDTRVTVQGWDGWLKEQATPRAEAEETRARGHLGLALPSLSGCLDTPSGRTPLLRYPLQLSSPRRVRLRPSFETSIAGADRLVDPSLRGVLGGPCPFPCIQIDDVDIVAGAATEVRGS